MPNISWKDMDDGDLARLIGSISPLNRTALICACGERVYRVYDEFWVGDYCSAVKEAVVFGWQHSSGVALDKIRKVQLLDDLVATVEFLNEEDITILASSATVSLRLVESIAAPEPDSIQAVERALWSTLYVAQMAGDCVDGDKGSDLAEQEETAWLDSALALVQQATVPCNKESFEGLGSMSPKWWDAYKACSRH